MSLAPLALVAVLPLILVGDTPIDRPTDEARRRASDEDASEYKRKARDTKKQAQRKQGNHGKMGKIGPQNDQFHNAAKAAIRAAGMAESADLVDKLHRSLNGQYSNYRDMVQGMIEFLTTK